MRAYFRILVLLGLLLPTLLNAQRTEPPKGKEVQVIFADVGENIVQDGQVVKRLIGNVQLRQDSVFMYCDSAIIYNDIDVVAMGNVLIQQSDSLSIFADSLRYQGAERLADLYSNVVLLHGNQKLFTETLHYDLNTNVATYETGALLTNDTTQLTSIRGYYYVNLDELYFKDSVVVVDPQFELKSDTLLYNTRTKFVYFLGPTLITQNDSRIYCEDGYYDTEGQKAEFAQNPQYERDSTRANSRVMRYDGALREVRLIGDAQFDDGARCAEADIIRYDEVNDIFDLWGRARYEDNDQEVAGDSLRYNRRLETYATRGRSRVSNPPQILEAELIDFDKSSGLGIAWGQVVWQDTSERISILCDTANYNNKTSFFRAWGNDYERPILLSEVDADTLFLSADTLISYRPDSLENDSVRMMLAFNDVRIFKSNLQGRCDSLVYDGTDSTFRFFVNPVMWSDSSQFSADTMHIKMADNKIDRILLYQQSTIINTNDEIFYNQIQGKYITVFFADSEIRRMFVDGNALSVYYAQNEEKAYSGVNKTLCAEMMMYFEEGELDNIRFYTQPEGEFLPMDKANHEGLKVPGFRWEISRRPRNLDDLKNTGPL
jgi:lipopolysaccharide export system protein LptA